MNGKQHISELTFAQRLAIIYRRCLQIYAERIQSGKYVEADPVRAR